MKEAVVHRISFENNGAEECRRTVYDLMVQIVGLDCPCVYREVTLQVNEVTAKCGMQEYSPPPGVSEHPEYILVLCQDEIGSYSLSSSFQVLVGRTLGCVVRKETCKTFEPTSLSRC